MRNTKTILGSLLLLSLALLMQVSAHSTIHRSVESLAGTATFIVEGTVLRAESGWSPDGTRIYTYADVAVDQTWKGPDFPPVLRLRILGGQLGELAFSFEDGPAFVPDERVVLFLEKNPQSLFPIAGVGEGLFRVVIDPTTGVLTAVNSHGVSLSKVEFDRRLQAALR